MIESNRKCNERQYGSKKQISKWTLYFKMLLIATLIVSTFPSAVSAAIVLEEYTYLDEDGTEQTHEAMVIDADNSGYYSRLTTGWYILRGEWASSTITVEGDVAIILEDGSDVTVQGPSSNAGIDVSTGNSLTIYAQSTGESIGKLHAKSAQQGSGIGGRFGISGGTVTINGGWIIATGGAGGSGIGGGSDGGVGATVTINGGDITATGGGYGSGIGGGSDGGVGGTVTINGGEIMATGGSYASGIGGGYDGSGGTVTINGGEITAVGGLEGSGIGGGKWGSGGTVTINGGEVSATGGDFGAGIGGGILESGGTVTINGGAITATGGIDASGIGGGSNGSDGTITINGTYYYWASDTERGQDGDLLRESFNGVTDELEGFRYAELYSVDFIDSAALTVTAPVTGATPSEVANAGTANFTASNVTWSPSASTFAANTAYTASVTLTANSGYAFVSTLTTATINGYTASVTSNTGETVTLSYTFAGEHMYLDEDGTEQTHEAIVIDADNSGHYSTLTTGWYILRGEWLLSSTITVEGDVTIILEDGSDVTIQGQDGNAGINVSTGKSLTIYAQSTGESMGKLHATGGLGGSGIGGGYVGAGGEITINGGEITATGGTDGSGIGGGSYSAGGTVTINGGEITATGGLYASGIGGGAAGAGGEITINGGEITATGGNNGSGIGGGYFGSDGTITINGTFDYWSSDTERGQDENLLFSSFNGITEEFEGFRYAELYWSEVDFIDSAALTVTAPVTGATPSEAADAGTANYTSSNVTWSPSASPFAANTAYKASVTLTANNGYAFASTLTTATINGYTASVTSNTGETVTLSYTFAGEFTYLDEDGTEQTHEAILIDADSSGHYSTLTTGWYILRGEWTSSTITVNGDVTIILEDGSDVTVQGPSSNAGIDVSTGNSLTIYAQSTGESMGKLYATGGDLGSGIGGGNEGSGGTVTINGGEITTIGGLFGSGIGGGFWRSGGTVTINGGEITTTGGADGAGIGGGRHGSGGTVTINGGVITATGDFGGAGIGGGVGGDGGEITVNGGVITATGQGLGSGIGGGDSGAGGTVTINGGEIIATGGDLGSGIGGGSDGAGITITINGTFDYWSSDTERGQDGELSRESFNGVTETFYGFRYAELYSVELIGSAALTVTAPVRGATPSEVADAGTANYTASNVTWSPSASTFAANTAYTASVTLTANSDYAFASTLTTATINGYTASVTSNTGETVTLTYTFAATGSSGGGGGGGTSLPPSLLEEPAIEIEEEPKPTATEVFKRNIVNRVALVAKLAALVASSEQAASTRGFTDTDGHWAKAAIATFLALQLIDGYEDGTFKPNAAITRAEFITMLSRAFGIDSHASSSEVFKDLDKHWAESTIVTLAVLGVVTGYEDGTFRPEQTITREEMVIMLSRIVNVNSVAKDASKGNFTDIKVSYAANDIQAIAQAGIVNGKNEQQFDPKGIATRAEALQIILNALNLDPEVKALLDQINMN